MANMLNNVVQLFTGQLNVPGAPPRPTPPRRYSERELLKMESAIGRELFGPVPAGYQREFFCLDKRTWIWYEHWRDPQTHKQHEMTTRYEVHPNGIVKIQEGKPYEVIEGEELNNLHMAIKLYHQRVMGEIYGPYNPKFASNSASA
jgi:hypothetical protein